MLIGEIDVPIRRQARQLGDNLLDARVRETYQFAAEALLHPRIVEMGQTIAAGWESAGPQHLEEGVENFTMKPRD